MRSSPRRPIPKLLMLALGIYLMFFGCSKKSPTAPNHPRLFIWSLPDSASIMLDGSLQSGKTPLTIKSISPGQHLVQCTYSGLWGVDTVEVHSGRSLPDTALCLIQGFLNVTSAPESAEVQLHGRHGVAASGKTPMLWSPAFSDTYEVVCNHPTGGYFAAVDTMRIWADSTYRNYVLPPKVDSTIVWGHTSSGWERGGPFHSPDEIVVESYLSQPTPVADLPIHYNLLRDGYLVDTVTFLVPKDVMILGVGMMNPPVGFYSLRPSWLVVPHAFSLPNSSWLVLADLPGAKTGPLKLSFKSHPFHWRRYSRTSRRSFHGSPTSGAIKPSVFK